MRSRTIIVAALLALAAAFPWPAGASIMAPEPDEYVVCEVEVGTASHVGYAYYPWRETMRLRQSWEQLPTDFPVEDIDLTRVVATHSALHDSSYIGRVVWIRSLESGVWDWAVIVDAMRTPRVVDLTPAQFNRLLGWVAVEGGRGGQTVEMWTCGRYAP